MKNLTISKMFKTVLFAGLLGIPISGCDHYSTKMANMEPPSNQVYGIEPASGGAMTFRGYLANEYYSLARYEQNQTKDYPAAKKYFTKAEALSDGQMVSLNNIKNYKIKDAGLKAELKQARLEIDNALKMYRTPNNRWALAVAHSRFDCWLDEAEEQKKTTACKAQFKEAMNSLVAPQPVLEAEQSANTYLYDDASALGF